MRLFVRTVVLLFLAGLVLPTLLRADPGILKIGEKPEDFALTATDGKQVTLHQKEAPKATAVFFLATLCPISNRYNERMTRFAAEYGPKGVRFIGINSNDPEPMEEVAEHAKKHGFPFPVVKDLKNVIADNWGATITPEVYVFDQKGTLQYHGRIDDHMAERKAMSPDLKNALEALLAGRKPEKAETKPHGCSIKRAGPP
jgi:peroxiredoxin